VLNDPTYVPQRWHATLILYAVLIITLFVNTLLVKFLPSLEGLILILHVVGFFAILIPIVHLGPISSASFVFTNFTNLSGYSSNGASWFIGQSASAILFIGYDGACHMGESRSRPALCCHLTPTHSRGSPKRISQCAPGNVLYDFHKWRSRICHVYRHPLLLRQCPRYSEHSNWLAIHSNLLQFDSVKSRRDSYDIDSHRHVHFCHVWLPRFGFEAGVGLRP
jgi:hypothetical protein